MMKDAIRNLILLISGCFMLLPEAGSSFTVQDGPGISVPYYELGRKKMDQGEWEVALRVWSQGIHTLQNNNTVDPRLGFALIGAAAEYNAGEYYRDANFAYFWALREEAFEANRDVYRAEVERLLPIMDSETQRKVTGKLRRKEASLITDIRTFWEKEDPILTTELNERLIEHWERIAYAKKNYRRENTTIYGTDDRGKIYIKYGLPASSYKGTLTFDNAYLRSKASELIDLMNPASGIRTDSTSSTLGYSRNSQMNKDLMVENLVRRVRAYFRNSRYVIWIYPPEENELDNSIFIFGQDGDTGVFGLRRSVEELIPRGAFGLRGDQARTAGVAISPGLLLQLMAYSELSPYDQHFLDNLLDIESDVFSIHNNNTVFIDEVVKSRNEFKMQRIQAKLPPENSTVVEETAPIDINYGYYRMLEDNSPVLLVSLFSNPHKALMLNWAQKVNEKAEYDFNLMHSVKLLSDRYRHSITKTDTARLYFVTSQGDSTIRAASQSMFMLPNIKNAENILSAELQDYSTKKFASNEPFVIGKDLLGLGLQRFIHPEPLSTREDILEMSDLILGYSRSPEKDYFLPFLLSIENSIPKGENLVVHFEVYHLEQGPDGHASFTVDYAIKPREKGLRRLLGFENDNQVQLTLNFTSASSDFKENLEIETAGLEPGRYRLTLRASDLNNEESRVERTVEFEVRE